MDALPVTRSESVRLVPDPRRVIVKPFLPGAEVAPDGTSRLQMVIDRVLALSDAEVDTTLRDARASFGDRHRDLDSILERHVLTLAGIGHLSLDVDDLTAERRLLLGAFCTHEYSIEAAALSNPSMVVAPDQTGVEPGATRFVMSLRAIGEGHLSSIEFRSGVLDSSASVVLDPPTRYVMVGELTEHAFDTGFFRTRLHELGAMGEVEERVFGQLGDRFTMSELEGAIGGLESGDAASRALATETTHLIHWLAASNYRVSFPENSDISERVLFPNGPTESRGMEDARFVRFVDDGVVTYYATYTAFDGHQILPQLLETTDFRSFRVATLSGQAAHNKGMALFPRKINGNYMALGRHDNVNNFVMASDDIRVWHETDIIQEPERPWELMQLGNCGSPIETEAGWLVITHGVGHFRRYSLGALLLDLDDPSRVIGHLAEPLLEPSGDERDGYVPNVVYSCGSMLHAGHLVVPYGYSDVGANVATVALDQLLSRLTSR